MKIIINHRGGELTIHGKKESVLSARNAIEFLYNKVDNGNAIEMADVDSAIRFSDNDFFTWRCVIGNYYYASETYFRA